MTDTPNALEPVLKFLRQHDPFRHMLPVHQEYLAMVLEQVFFAEADSIAQPEDGVVDNLYIIKRGCVSGEVNISAKKEPSSPVMLLQPGDSFPICALLQHRAVNFQHRAIKSTICYQLKRVHFQYLMQQSTVFHDFYDQHLDLSNSCSRATNESERT